MVETIKKILYIIPASNIRLVSMIILFLLTSGLEVIGIGAVAPFISLAGNPTLIYENSFSRTLFELSGINDESKFIAMLGVLVALLFCTKTFFSWFTQVCIVKFSDHQQQLLSVSLFKKYLYAPYIHHTERNSSHIVDSIVEVANKFALVIVQPLFLMIANAIVTITLFILLYTASSSTLIVLLIAILPILLLLISFKQKLKKWGKEARKSKINTIRIINHAFGSIKETKMLGCESYFADQILAQAKVLERSHSNFASFKTIPRFLIEAAVVVCVVSIICFSLYQGQNIDNLQGVLGIYTLASIRLLPSISNLINGLNTLRNASFTINQLYFDLVDLEKMENWQLNCLSKLTGVEKSTSLINRENEAKLSFQNQIVLNEIRYRYSQYLEDAVHNISLKIKKGDSVAFIGKSGAGKTTLIDVFLGLLIPQKGDLRVDGISVYTNLRAWQNLIAYIPQSIFLTDDTIERNIAFGVPDRLIDSKKVEQAIEAAQLGEVIQNLPNGINTRVGERGVLLSGGQRQRVGIARAIYHEREILVLDEATAALDTETEKLVTDAINALSEKKTLIIIAHRLSTVRGCDRIYQLDRGRIIKSGSYQEVVIEGK